MKTWISKHIFLSICAFIALIVAAMLITRKEEDFETKNELVG